MYLTCFDTFSRLNAWFLCTREETPSLNSFQNGVLPDMGRIRGTKTRDSNEETFTTPSKARLVELCVWPPRMAVLASNKCENADLNLSITHGPNPGALSQQHLFVCQFLSNFLRSSPQRQA